LIRRRISVGVGGLAGFVRFLDIPLTVFTAL
jgi:hypothetical protein